jgi:hypothetical protein
MRTVILLALVACNKDKPKPAPAPAVVTDATPIDAALDAATPDAPPTPSIPVITQDGIGKLQRFAWHAQDEQATAKLIAAALTPDIPGIEASFSVLDVPGEVEREEGYWSVKKQDKEIIQVLRTYDLPDKDAPAVIIAWSADVATADGVKVGDPLSRVLEKHPDLACKNGAEMIAEVISADLTCTGGGLMYLLDPNKQKVKGAKPAASKLAAVLIVGIVAIPKP